MYRMGLLPRIFPAFPPGFPGVALLLVRVVIGVALAGHGAIVHVHQGGEARRFLHGIDVMDVRAFAGGRGQEDYRKQ